MTYLLNLAKESEKRYRDKKEKYCEMVMDSFLEIVRSRSLVNLDKLDRLLLETESPTDKKR